MSATTRSLGQTRNILNILFFIVTVYLVGYLILYTIDRRKNIRLQKERSRLKGTQSEIPPGLYPQFMFSNELVYDDMSFGANGSAKHLEKLRILPSANLPAVSCKKVLNANVEEIDRVKLKVLELKSKAYEAQRKELDMWSEKLSLLTKNCSDLKQRRQYITQPLTAEEKNYAIAYIITVHRDFGSFERLFRAIYHPQNVYCVHVDAKSDEKFQTDVRNLLECFDNAFVASVLIKVYYTHYSRVQADLNCLQDLLKVHQTVRWRYVINLCALDFPLKTNYEIVRSFKALYGYNNLESIAAPEHKKKRYTFRFELPSDLSHEHEVLKKTSVTKSPVPIKTDMFAGSAYFIFKYEAIKVILTDPDIAKFLKWNEDTYSPDEHIWATLQRLHYIVPGSFLPNAKYDLNELQSITRLVKWGGMDPQIYPTCAGVYVRGVCVYGVGDLAWLVRHHHLFANKFDSNIDPYAIDCLDVWLRNKTIEQTRREETFPTKALQGVSLPCHMDRYPVPEKYFRSIDRKRRISVVACYLQLGSTVDKCRIVVKPHFGNRQIAFI